MDYQLSVELSNYAVNGMDGFGTSTQNDLDMLTKAMTAGDITGRDTENQGATGGAVLKVESLENMLKVLTYKESDIVLWKRIPKLPAYNTVEEYDQLVEYGAMGNSFNNEGELPEEDDSIYARKSQLVKYMGKTGSVSHPMQLVQVISGVGNVMQHKTQNTTLSLLRDADMALLNGDSDIVKQEWNGLYKQHKQAFSTLSAYYDSEVVIDLKGKILTEAAIEAAALSLIENHGEASLIMAPPGVLSDFTNNFYGQKYFHPNSPEVTAGVVGQKVAAVATQFGTIELGYDKFMSNKYVGKAKAAVGSSATNLKAPAAPSAVATAAVADTTAKYAGFLGDYGVAVSAVNRYGESALTEGANVTIAANQAIAITITAGTGAVAATGYKIYRTEVNQVTGTKKYFYLFSVSTTEVATGYDGGGAGIVWDKNRIIPNTESAFITDPSLDVWSFKQLAPLMKMDLAVVAPASRFMVLLYGTPILYAPKKFVKFINIGKTLA